jgi:predicted transcriptional regulator
VARKKSPHLTDAELRLMEVLWEKGPATVSAVVASLPAYPAPAYSTVLTTLRILENKGYLRHTQEGRAFLYHALVGRDEARLSAVRHLVRRFFAGSPELLVLNLIQGKQIDPAELERLRQRIEEVES